MKTFRPGFKPVFTDEPEEVPATKAEDAPISIEDAKRLAELRQLQAEAMLAQAEKDADAAKLQVPDPNAPPATSQPSATVIQPAVDPLAT